MNRYFDVGQMLHFDDVKCAYTVNQIIGRGSSCVVYKATASDGTEHLLKEFNPSYLELFRGDDECLAVGSAEDKKRFEAGLTRFRDGYIKQINVRKTSELKNTTANVQAIHSAYGTEYIDMSCFRGSTFDKIRPRSLYELIRYLKTITAILGNYHRQGFLHLDIKPENIFTIPETPELAILFDFDSVTQKGDVCFTDTLSYTKSWAAPEQLVPNKRYQICEATDMYALGEILFWFVTGRHSTPDDRRSFTKIRFDKSDALFNGVDDAVFSKLEAVLKATLCGVVSKRIQSTDELMGLLDALIPLTNPELPHLICKLPAPFPTNIFGETEFSEMDKLVDEKQKVFLSDSSNVRLVLEYILARIDRYNRVMHLIYHDGFASMLDDETALISNFYKRDGETADDYRKRKLQLLSQLVDENDLMVICNFTDPNDTLLDNFKHLKCKIIFLSNTPLSMYDFGEDPAKNVFCTYVLNIVREGLLPKILKSTSTETYCKGDEQTDSVRRLIDEFDADIDIADVFFCAVFYKNDEPFGLIITDEGWFSKTKSLAREDLLYADYSTIKLINFLSYKIDKNDVNRGWLRTTWRGEDDVLKQILLYYHKFYKPSKNKHIHVKTKEEIFEEFVWSTVNEHLVGKDKSHSQSQYYDQRSGMPDAIYRAISEFAHGVDPEDIIVYLDLTVFSPGKAGTIITKDGYYEKVPVFQLKTTFQFKDVERIFDDGQPWHNAYYYFDRRGKRQNLYLAGAEREFVVISKILKKYHELLGDSGDGFNRENFTHFKK